jgi:hypothetical protein
VVVITGPVSDEIDRIPVGEAELFDVARVDEDDVATALDAAIAVAEPVDGGVVLVVGERRNPGARLAGDAE